MRSLLRSRSGTAAAEMALTLPILMILLFGSVEVGKFFLDEHVVVKSVRDGARFAARQPMEHFATSAGGCQTVPAGSWVEDTKNLVRTGSLAGTGKRLAYWTDNATITVTVSCSATAGGQNMGGIYHGVSHGGSAVGAPVVTVSASVPYTSLFGLFVFGSSLSLNASQQAAVMGV